MARRKPKPTDDRVTAADVIAFIQQVCLIPEGKFVGQPLMLQDWQQELIRLIYDNPHGTRRAIISVGRKNAKGLALDTPIATPRGWSTMRALNVGDQVFDDRGQPCRVKYVSPVHVGLRCWRLRFADGSEIVADEQHRWLTKHRIGHDMGWGVVTTPEIAARVHVNRMDGVVEHAHKVPVAGALEMPEADLLIPPYVLGYWLGNGVARAARVTTGWRDCTDIVEQLEQELGFAPSFPAPGWKPPTFGLTRGYGSALPIVHRETVQHRLRELDVLNNKHVPEVYKWASREQRLALLQGLMDSDGSSSRGTGTPRCYFANTNERLIRDTLFLVRSLGFKASVSEGRAKLNGCDLGPAWTVGFAAYREDEVFRLERRRDKLLSRPSKRRGRSAVNAIVACDEVASVPTVCIQVDSPSQLFLAGEGLTPTHNTSLAACLLLNHLCGPSAKSRPNSQLYSAAQSRDQAAIIFSLASKMARLNPALARIVHVMETAKTLVCNELGTRYRALSADASTALGLSPSFIVHDELGQCRGPRSPLYEALETATAASVDPLSIVISTQAPTDADLLSVLIDDALAEHDPRTVIKLYTAPRELDAFDEATIKLANPAYGTFLNPREVLDMAAAARRMPARQAEYENLILNRRVESSNVFVTPAVWKACGEEPGALAGLTLYGGLDLSEVADLTALVLIGWRDNKWRVQPTFWLPEQGLAERSTTDHVPYDLWRARGFLQTTPGKTISYEFVAEHLRGLFRRYNIAKIGFDRWNMRHFLPWLLKAGLSEQFVKEHFVEFGQGMQSMSPALRDLEQVLLEGQIAHGDHPVLSMCASNTVIAVDDAGNRKPSKKRSVGRIDGLVALAMAIGVAPLKAEPVIDVQALIG